MENKLKATLEVKLKLKMKAKMKNKNTATTTAGGTAPASFICGNCAKIDSSEKI